MLSYYNIIYTTFMFEIVMDLEIKLYLPLNLISLFICIYIVLAVFTQLISGYGEHGKEIALYV